MKTYLTVILSMLALILPAQEITVDVEIENPYILIGPEQRTYIKIGITGEPLERSQDRAPMNVCIVLDRSGSMYGEKIEQAREAARYAVQLMGSEDILSIITYESSVEVLLPATRIADKNRIYRLIEEIYPDGNTALFAGVSKGSEEIGKFLDDNRVNRIILLSDGLANVGPDSPGALGDLGASLRKEGISVTTIGLGLGYNEDLMFRLAQSSDGNHAFVENARDLVRIFDYEFKDLMAVVAQDVRIRIELSRGFRPIRVLGREGEIFGSTLEIPLNQVYSNQEKYVLVEVETPEEQELGERMVAEVEVSFQNLNSGVEENLSQELSVTYTGDRETVEQGVNRDVREAVVLQIATEVTDRAVALRDQGLVEEAQEVLSDNATFLADAAEELESELLLDFSVENRSEAAGLDSDDWNEQRKRLRESQYVNQTQQTYQ